MNFLPILIAKKLRLNQKKRFIEFLISILSKFSIAISTFALVMSFSALNGFQILLNKKILSHFPHGIIQFTNTSSLKWQDVIKKLNFLPGIDYSEPYIITNGLVSKKNKIKLIEIKSFSDIKYLKKKFL